MGSGKRSHTGNWVSPGLRSIPSVDRVLAHPRVASLRQELPQNIITAAVREELDDIRRSIQAGEEKVPSIEGVAERSAARAMRMIAPGLRPVLNATGVIIHTNLGRAPLSAAALEAVREAAAYSNLEYDLEKGERGSRYDHAVEILRRVTGCEDALVVNNNAAGLVLALTCLAQGREAILSRGQSVEIGGGFRIPEIMRTSGARLVEVGTTNRTYARDYAEAITADTSLIMRVHASNFRIIGFTVAPGVEELAALAHERGLLMVDDIGSGALLDTTRFGLAPEPMVQTSIQAGADLVLFSGDKLLGGPQCGVIAGKSSVIVRLRKHPLVRALRVDKVALAALEATLLHYLKGEAEQQVPVWRMISIGADELKEKAEAWALQLRDQGIECSVEQGRSTIGGGSLPGETLPTWLLSITPQHHDGSAAAASLYSINWAGDFAGRLRHAETPIIARVERGALLVDPRTVLDKEEEVLLRGVLEEAAKMPG